MSVLQPMWHGRYMIRSGALARVLENGITESVPSQSGLTYCVVDPRSDSIWLLGDAGVSVYDLQTQTREIVVAAAPGDIEAFEVRFGLNQGKLGNADSKLHDVALIVVAAKRSSIRSEIICEGKRQSSCYLASDDDDPELWELRPAAAALKSRYDAMTFANPEFMMTLSARRMAASDDVGGKPAPSDVGDSGCGWIPISE